MDHEIDQMLELSFHRMVIEGTPQSVRDKLAEVIFDYRKSVAGVELHRAKSHWKDRVTSSGAPKP